MYLTGLKFKYIRSKIHQTREVHLVHDFFFIYDLLPYTRFYRLIQRMILAERNWLQININANKQTNKKNE